jgi:hypothetical protein
MNDLEKEMDLKRAVLKTRFSFLLFETTMTFINKFAEGFALCAGVLIAAKIIIGW